MANLPNSRTVTLAPSDPFPSALGNELQDMIIGAKRKAWVSSQYLAPLTMVNFAVSTPGFGLVSWTSSSTGASITFGIPYNEGDRLIGIRYWAFGDGVVDSFGGKVQYATTFGTATTLAAWDDINRPAAWGMVDVTVISSGPAFTPTVLAANGTLFMFINATAAGLAIGMPIAVFDRL